MKDKTNVMPVLPTVEDFDKIIGRDILNGWYLRFIDIGNTSTLDPHDFVLALDSLTGTPSSMRRVQFQRFKSQVSTFLMNDTHHIDSAGLKQSIIFENLTNQIEFLGSIKGADHKVILLYTDGFENDNISFYDTGIFRHLSKNPLSFVDELLPLRKTDYSDISIYWVYKCDSYKQNKRFRVLRNFYRTILDEFKIKFIAVPVTPTNINSNGNH